MEVSQLTAEQKADIKKHYVKQLGKDTDGLTQNQAWDALNGLGKKQTLLDVSKKWTDLEKTDGQTVSLDEFERLCCMTNEDPEKVFRWAFNKYDVNNDGTIDKDELRKILTTVYGDFADDDFVNAVLLMADENSDGVLQVEEFVDHLMARTGQTKK